MSGRPLSIVIPMAGRGSRFRDQGWTTPKPLIPALGEPMYSWALKGLPLERARRIILVVLGELARNEDFRADVARRYGHLPIEVLEIGGVTEGQACTVLQARARISPDDGLLIHNADTFQSSASLPRLLADPDVDGVLCVFPASGEQWSFVRCDDSHRVLETAEKRRISNLASTGLYYFARASDFLWAADEAMTKDERTNGEFYVAPLYNALIASGRRIYADVVDQVHSLGTPSDLRRFISIRSDGRVE